MRLPVKSRIAFRKMTREPESVSIICLGTHRLQYAIHCSVYSPENALAVHPQVDGFEPCSSGSTRLQVDDPSTVEARTLGAAAPVSSATT